MYSISRLRRRIWKASVRSTKPADSIGRSVGTPGLITTNESSSIISSGNVPSTILNCPFSFLVSKILASISSAHSFSFPSYKTTSAPFSSKSLHDPSPLIPEPKTSTFFSSYIHFYTPHQRNEAKQRRYDRKYSYHSRFRPSA